MYSICEGLLFNVHSRSVLCFSDLPLTMNGAENGAGGGGGGGDSDPGGDNGAGAANNLLSPKAPPSDCSDRSDTKSDARSGTASPNTNKTGEKAKRKVRPSNGEADPGVSRAVPGKHLTCWISLCSCRHSTAPWLIPQRGGCQEGKETLRLIMGHGQNFEPIMRHFVADENCINPCCAESLWWHILMA